MDPLSIALGAMALTLAVVAWQARRAGNERRDVVLLASIAALFGAGTALAAVL